MLHLPLCCFTLKWLSKGNMVAQFFELQIKVKKFLEIKNLQELLATMLADLYELYSAYLVDVLAALNNLNLKMLFILLALIDQLSPYVHKLYY